MTTILKSVFSAFLAVFAVFSAFGSGVAESGDSVTITSTSVADTAALQSALDSCKSNTIIYLTAGVAYDLVYIGRPTKSNATVMYCPTHDFTTIDVAEFTAHLADGNFHTTPHYTTTLDNVMIVGAEGATIAGVKVTSGHAYGDVYDYVREKDYDSGSAYYAMLYLSNLKFSGVNFSGKIDINTSHEDSVYDGVTFENCTFTTGGTASDNGCAVRYYNEANNGNVKNIAVSGCAFENCYQGVYVQNVNTVSVTDSTFKTIGHNAIALQSGTEAVDLGTVTISGNTFTDVADRVIRFNLVDADSTVSITGNTAINSGDEDGELMKATSVADGGTITRSGNTWNGFTDAQLVEENGTISIPVAKIGETTYAVLAEALAAASAMTGDVTVEILDKVTLNTSLSGTYDSITFVGKDTDAEIYLDVQGYITATGKKVAFKDLTLSKSQGGFITNAGFMNVAFGVYNVAEVAYTNCTFANGAYASSGKVTYTGCTFKRSWDKYGLWAYGNADITVDGCTFEDYRGIKMYAENQQKVTDLTVKNTDFSAVTDKPAIVLTYGESVTLEGNTYSSTGTFELDLDGAPNGVAVTSDVAPTCVNDNGACGVLVDGKIYTTVAQAAEVVTSGSTVTLLHDSTETVELTAGVTLDKNGYTAAGITVEKVLAGSGTEADPYLITTLEELVLFRDSVNAGKTKYNAAGVYVALGANIDLAGISWTPVGIAVYNSSYVLTDEAKVFCGIFDGKDHVLSNLKIEKMFNGGADADANLGLFGITGEGAVIKNLTITNVDIDTDGRNVGAVAGVTYKGTTLANITVNGDIQIVGGNNVSGVGGMTRYAEVSATNIKVSGDAGSTINGNNIVGGIFAEIAPKGTACVFNGLTVEGVAINGVGGVGGIVGLLTTGAVSDVTVKNVTLVGKTTWTDHPEGRIRLGSVAGLLGSNYSTISNASVENVTAKNLEGKDVILPIIGANYSGSIGNATEAKIGDTYYATLQLAINAVKDGETIVLLADCDATITFTQTADVSFVLDGNGKTMTGSINITARAGKDALSTLEIKNFNFKTDEAEHTFIYSVETSYYPNNITISNCTFEGTGTDYSSVIPVNMKSANNLKIVGCTATNVHSLLQNTAGWNITVQDTTVTGYRGMALGTAQNVLIDNVTITAADNKYGIRLDGEIPDNTITVQNSKISAFIPVVVRDAIVENYNIVFDGTNTMTPANTDGLWCAIGTSEYEKNGTMPTAATGKVKVTLNDADLSYDGVYGNYCPVQIGDKTYATLALAAAAAQSGDEIVLLDDVTESVTLPDGVVFNGNGKTVDGTVTVGGALTIKGVIKVKTFSAASGDVVNIGEGATLEQTTGRMVIGHGATFNITGSIADAKMADTAELTPSLIAPGASFTGNGVTFNVVNAYVKFTAYCSSKNSAANGTFNFNVTNSIWEQTNKLSFEEPKSGMDPTVNFTLKDSVLTTTSHLVFAVTKGEIIIDNSKVNEGVYNQLENRSTLTIKNGSVVYASVQTSSNAKNPGTTIVDNATYIATGTFSGSDVGVGTLIVKNGATVEVDEISTDKATVQLGAGCTLKTDTEGLDITTDDGYDVSYVDGKYTAVEKVLSGSGTEEDPYVVASIDDLKLLATKVKNGNTFDDQFVKLTADIDLAGAAWEPIGNGTTKFLGIFDGDSKTISNLMVDVDTNHAGLFGFASVIKNVNLVNAQVSGVVCVGALVGELESSVGTVDNCHVSGTIEITGENSVGGIAGKGYANIKNSSVDGGDAATSFVLGVAGTTEEGDNVGGVIGHLGEGLGLGVANTTVKNITVSGTRKVGGLVGTTQRCDSFTENTVENVTVTCTATAEYADANAPTTTIGGLIGNYFGGGTGGALTGNTISNVILVPGYAKSAGSLVGGNRTTPGAAFDGVSTTGDANIVTAVAGATNTYLLGIEMTDDDGNVTYLSNFRKFATSNVTLKLIADVGDYNLNMSGLKGVTLDLNGYTFGKQIMLMTGSELTIKDTSVNQTGKVVNTSDDAIAIMNGTLVVESGTIETTDTDAAAIDAMGAATVTITGGKLISANDGIQVGSNYLEKKGTSSIVISGGEIVATGYGIVSGSYAQAETAVAVSDGQITSNNANLSIETGVTTVIGGTFSSDVSDYLAEGYLIEQNENGTYGVVVDPAYGKSAKIGDTYYDTLQAAIDAAKENETVKLLNDITIDENTRYNSGNGWYEGVYCEDDKSFTLDLNGYKLTNDSSVNDYLMLFKNVGTKANVITIRNGTIEAGATAYSAVCTSSASNQQITINLSSVNVIGNNSNGAVCKIRGGTVLNVKSGTVITGTDSYLCIESVASTVNIYGGAQIYQNGITSYNGCLVGVSYGATVNVYGGSGKSAKGCFIAMTSGGTINISGGEWIANTDGTYADGNKSVLIAQSDKSEYEGACNSIINVAGGAFKGGYNCYGDTVGDAQIIISGGNFNADPSTYVKTGYATVTNTDNTYDVMVGGAVAMVGWDSYKTFGEAVTAAIAAGETMELVSNASISEEVVINANLLVEMNGMTLTKADGGSIKVENATVNLAGGTLADFTASDIVLSGNATITLPSQVEVTGAGYTSKNADDTYSYATAFRSYIQVVAGVPCIGFLKDTGDDYTYTLKGKTDLTETEWSVVDTVDADEAAEDPLLPLHWTKPASGDCRFFKVECPTK